MITQQYDSVLAYVDEEELKGFFGILGRVGYSDLTYSLHKLVGPNCYHHPKDYYDHNPNPTGVVHLIPWEFLQ